MRRSPQYAVAITAVHKWEERFMREWLEYHLLVGVGHFFLFPNDCDASDSAVPKTGQARPAATHAFASARAS